MFTATQHIEQNQPFFMDEKFKRFIQAEFWKIVAFLLVMFCITILPDFFSFSGKGELYERYYSKSVPMTLPQLISIIFFIRVVIVVAYNLFQLRRRKKAWKEKQSQIFSV